LAYFKEPYVRVKENNLFVDCNLANYEIVNYNIVNNIYPCQANVISEIKQSGAEITDDTSYIAPAKIQLMGQYKLSFKELFEMYCLILDNQDKYTLTPDYRLELIVYRNPLVKEAYDKLGREEVQRMKHHQSNIKKKLIELSYKKNDYKIVEMINETLPHQKAIPVKKVKEELQSIYNQLGMPERTAKATDLKN
jgi:hypothetical protein